ncbi:MAG TPA: BA14K family protein [Xanthobacteraceae bacterium]|nr:BA14K family protein [Xanthobacteraceae bacterium]
MVRSTIFAAIAAAATTSGSFAFPSGASAQELIADVAGGVLAAPGLAADVVIGAPPYAGWGYGYAPPPAHPYAPGFAWGPGYGYTYGRTYSYGPAYAPPPPVDYSETTYAAPTATTTTTTTVNSGVSYCAQRYRSYDPGTGTFTGFDGIRRPCP